MLIRLLGEPAIIDADGAVQEVRGHQAFALLARVVLAKQPLARRALATELFPDVADPLGALRWCLASLRKALDCADVLCGDPILLNFPTSITVDVWAIESDEFDAANGGPLLGTMEPRCGPEFATWLLVEREHAMSRQCAALRRQTLRAISQQDHVAAVRLAELGAHRDPFDESAQILLVRSLAASGMHAAAARQVAAVEELYLAELGERPSVLLRSAARKSVASGPMPVSQQASIRALLEAGRAAVAAGAIDAGADCLRRAMEDAERCGDASLVGEAAIELGTSLIHGMRSLDEGSVLLRQAYDAALRSGSVGIGARALSELGYVEALAGRRPAAATYLSDASRLAQCPADRATIHAFSAFNLVDWGRVDDGLEHHEQAVELARVAGRPRREIWALGLGGWALLSANRLDEAEIWLERCLALVNAERWIGFKPWPVALLGEVHTRQGRHDGNAEILEEAFALGCQLGDPCWESASARSMALHCAATGDLDAAWGWLDEANRRCIRDNFGYMALQVHIIADRAQVARRRDDAEAADAHGRAWIAAAARAHMDAQIPRAAAFLAGG